VRLAEVVEGRGGAVRGRGLEDLDGGLVGGEQDLGPAVAVEVGDERRREAVGVMLDRVPVVREVVPRLPEREVALVLVVVRGMVCLGFRSIRVGERMGKWLTWREKKTAKAARRRMPKSRFLIFHCGGRLRRPRPDLKEREGGGQCTSRQLLLAAAVE
jgi:hypothetical protein